MRYEQVRELVKNPELRIKDIAAQTGYNKGHVSRLRKESRFNDVIAQAVADEREACAKVCDDWPVGRDDVYSIAAAIRARGNT